MSSRRQYSSCDPCRRLKRKCVYEGSSRRPGPACLRCKELGYNCTFEYISARVEQKKKKRHAIASDYKRDQPQSTELTSIGELVQDVDTVDWNSVLQPRDGDIPLGLGELNDNITTDFLDLDDLGSEWQYFATVDSAQPPILDTNSMSSDSALQVSLRPQISGPGTQFQGTRISTSWKGSPTQLLNSTFTAISLGTCLYHTYAAMMHGMESRYLDYECNPFGPNHRYSFEIGDSSPVKGDGCPSSESHGSKTSVFSIRSLLRSVSSPRNSGQGGSPHNILHGDSISVTFVGLAKFLDHFSHFYGNKLDRRSRVEDERMLIAAQQVFALQWAVSSSHEKDIPFSIIQRSKDSPTEDLHVFASSWFKARSLISNATPGRSFTRVYAMILFHMSVPPEEARDVSAEINDILDQCLCQFEDLKNMVDEYVKLLSSTSAYRNLLQSSVKAFQWFAYIKDTFVTLLTERDCILTDDPFDLSVTCMRSTPRPVENLVDAEVPLLCQRAVLLIYRILRQTAKVKQIVRDARNLLEPSKLVSALNLAIDFVEEFNLTYDGFRKQCMMAFETLSSTSKLSFGYLTLFWGLGSLTLAEQIGLARNSPQALKGEFLKDAESKEKQYETAAISSIVEISTHVSNISATETSMDVSGDSGIKLPFISHHASLAPIVAVLSKSIDHIIQRIVDSETPIDQQNWMLMIKPVLTCLLDMKSTVAGSRSIQSPLNKLLASHGDLLMECWTIDNFDELLE